MKCNKFAIALTGILISSTAWAQGYVVDPPSRAAMCKQGKNNQCDNEAMYIADQVINATAFNGDFPEDGRLASGGLLQFSSLNSERATRWEKNSLEKGDLDISWQFTAPSRVASYKYYLTKADWQKRLDKANHLTRDSFASKPFCTQSGSDESVQGLITHRCQLPDGLGYQLIFAVAEMAPGGNGNRDRIYNVIDVDIGRIKVGRPTPINSEWTKEIATIDRLVSGEPLIAPVGKTINVRFLSHDGDKTVRDIHLSLPEGEENTWSYYVAEMINGTHTRIRAGAMHDDGNVYPEKDRINSIFVKANSPITHAEISFR